MHPSFRVALASLTEEFHVGLADLHARGLTFDDDNTNFSPTNTYLTNCLLSGLSFKHDLTSSSDQRQAIRDGLELERRW
jgi:hypothetical protein